MYEGGWVSTLSVYRPLRLVQELKQEIVAFYKLSIINYIAFFLLKVNSIGDLLVLTNRPFGETMLQTPLHLAYNKHPGLLPLYQKH